MKTQIIITTCIDIKTIVASAGSEDTGTCDKPVQIDKLSDPVLHSNCQKTCIYILSKDMNMINGSIQSDNKNADSKICIHGEKGDIVELCNVLITGEIDYEVNTYKIMFIKGSDILNPINMEKFWLAIVGDANIGDQATYKYFLKVQDKRNPQVKPSYFCWNFSITLC
jgi:hypothetical protein